MAGLLIYVLGSIGRSGKREAIVDFVSRSKVGRPDYEELSILSDSIYFGRHAKNENSPIDTPRFIPQCRKEYRERTKNIEKMSLTGKVTFVGEGYGVIDDFIYFDMSSMCSFSLSGEPKVGYEVQVDAERQQDAGWKATTVFVLNIGGATAFQTEKDQVLPECHTLGSINHITDHEITLDNGLSFSIEKLQTGYVPRVSDWIKLDLTTEGKLLCIRPLRTKNLTGTVTAAPRRGEGEIREGRVNDEVLLPLTSCEEGYIPHRGDLVSLQAIEVKGNWCVWRATKTVLVRRSTSERVSSYKPGSWVLRGGFPERSDIRKSTPSFLPRYPIPESLKKKVEEGSDILDSLPSLTHKLSMLNYADKLSALIYLEEIDSGIEIRRHGIQGAQLQRKGEYLTLRVPGMTDGKPDLSVSDSVVLRKSDRAHLVEYHGFIHHLLQENEEILLKFHTQFQENFSESESFDVEFKHSRVPFRRCHFAVRLAQRRGSSNFLFPKNVESRKSAEKNMRGSNGMVNTVAIEHFNNKLNCRQKQAVHRIFTKGSTSCPYIIFGPPGTGKTMTLVEIILQLYFSSTSSRILVCAPSNSAVDVICERIAMNERVKTGDMTRFNSIRRLESSIPATIAKYCHSEEELEVTSRYRIILTTCVNSGSFYGLQLANDHFTHICIDEAGQSTEPETLIPIGLQTNAQVIMTGDPEQLGPVVMSPLASMYGLNMSMLERLMKLTLYQYSTKHASGYDETVVTKLVNNYRSHPSLVELPSKLFYMNELVSCREKNDYGDLMNWSHLPKTGFPLIFHGVDGQQLRESDSPSLMNPEEVVQVVRYAKILARDQNILTSDIGIISPYKKQVEKIRMMLKAVKTDGVKVGSVEEFQGQERSVIIVSTVRSQSKNHDIEHTSVRASLGFLSNYRRFNVAVTRARDLLIIIGNPNLLKLDKHWDSLIEFACENGCYIGCEIKIA